MHRRTYRAAHGGAVCLQHLHKQPRGVSVRRFHSPTALPQHRSHCGQPRPGTRRNGRRHGRRAPVDRCRRVVEPWGGSRVALCPYPEAVAHAGAATGQDAVSQPHHTVRPHAVQVHPGAAGGRRGGAAGAAAGVAHLHHVNGGLIRGRAVEGEGQVCEQAGRAEVPELQGVLQAPGGGGEGVCAGADVRAGASAEQWAFDGEARAAGAQIPDLRAAGVPLRCAPARRRGISSAGWVHIGCCESATFAVQAMLI